jgi:hypothetical protein
VDSLVNDYRKLAKVADGNFGGLSVLQHVKSIRKLLTETESHTMLDFGCGRGEAYKSPHKLHHQLGLPRAAVTLYDPAFMPTSKLPVGQFDLVVCSDVLEHLPEHEVDDFVARLFEYAKKAVWASVCCRPAKKFFPDGRNLHTCVKPFEWWRDRFNAAHYKETGARHTTLGLPPDEGVPFTHVLVETP